jgi:hypothetical protein
MPKTKCGKKALEDLYDAQKNYLIKDRGWVIDCEHGDDTCTFTHPSYPNYTALINESDITFTHEYELTLPNGRTDCGLIEIDEDLVGRITID